MSLNISIVYGRVATSPVLKEINGSSVANFNIASDTLKKDADGKYVPIFYSVSAWGKIGERAAKYLTKGNPVVIVGNLSQRTYIDESGKDRFQNQLDAKYVEFVGGGKQAQETKPGSSPAPDPGDEDELPF